MELQGHNLSAVALSPYEWSVEFSKGQPKAYRPQNAPWVIKGPQEESGGETAQRRSPTTVDELIQRFLTVLGDSRMPHQPSRYQSLELEAFCRPGSLDVLEQGTRDCVNYALALLDDRSRQGYQALPSTVAGQQRRSRGPLSSFQLLQEPRKKVCPQGLVNSHEDNPANNCARLSGMNARVNPMLRDDYCKSP